MTWDENQPVVIGLGELLWDIFPDGKRPGGAPANVAYQAQQLGCQGVVASRVGIDELGDEVIEFLESKGLRILAIQRDELAPTGRVTVSFNDQNQPEYIIHENVAWDKLEFTDDLQQVMERANAVCFGTLAQRSEVSRRAVMQAVEATSENCLRVYDVNIRQNYYDVSWIQQSLKLASIVKMNDEEVELLAPQLKLPTDEKEFSITLIKKFDLKLVCITRGSKGCRLTSKEESITIPGEPVQVADTVGAGDAFTAGLIYSQLSGKSLKESGEIANKIGGLVASHHGAMPELKDEFTRLIS
ncbi:MAG: carbohydrate kinase [Planctomicrobium sp.]|nr:carbohydrate kinase [Planctomicrobium sp.]